MEFFRNGGSNFSFLRPEALEKVVASRNNKVQKNYFHNKKVVLNLSELKKQS